MKIINLAYEAYPLQNNPQQWIANSPFFRGIWERVAIKHEVIFYEFINHTGGLNIKGVTHRFSKPSKTELLIPFGINRKIIRERPDVVIVHSLQFPLQVLLLRFQWGSKARIIVQHHAEQPPQNPLKKYLLALADRYISAYFFTGKDHAEMWINKGLIRDRRKIKEVMEASSIFEPQDKQTARAATQMKAANVYLWVGHLNANKNPLLVVKAFLRFITDNGADAALYMIYQSNDLSPEIQILLQQHTDATKHVHLVGKIPHADLQTWFSAADFIVSSSYYEGSGIAVCEGMSCGCIPILTDIPSFRFMSGKCGFLYQPDNEDALVKALADSNGIDKEAQRQLVLNQYKRHLSFDAIADRIEEECLAVISATE